VDKNGKVTGVKYGTAVITAKIDNKTATCNVNVTTKTSTMRVIDKTSGKIGVGGHLTIGLGTGKKVTSKYNFDKNTSNEDKRFRHKADSGYQFIGWYEAPLGVTNISDILSKGTLKSSYPEFIPPAEWLETGKWYYAVFEKISEDINLQHQYLLNGTVIDSYQSNNTKISVEKINGYYVAKIWVRDPSKQLVKIDQSSSEWGHKVNTVKNYASRVSNVIIACNASGFNDSSIGATGQQKYGEPDWEFTPTGHLVMTNGVVRRARKQADGTEYTVGSGTIGILQDGGLVSLYKKTYQEVKDMGVKSTYNFGPVLIKNEKITNNLDNESKHPRTVFGQVDKNNYVIFLNDSERWRDGVYSYGNAKSKKELADFGAQLDCTFLFNCDGGGSSQLLFKDRYIHDASIKGYGHTRGVTDGIAFVDI